MIEFKFLRGNLKTTSHYGDYTLTLETLDDNLLFIEVTHNNGNESALMSEIIEMEYDYKDYLESGRNAMEYFSEVPVMRLRERMRRIISATFTIM